MKKLRAVFKITGILIFFCSVVNAQNVQGDTLVLRPSEIETFYPGALHALIFEDASYKYEWEDVLNEDVPFQKIGAAETSLGFTSSRYWIKLDVVFQDNSDYFLEIARPITNVVELYIPDKEGNYEKLNSGDAIPFSKKSFPHRKSLFKLDHLPINVPVTFYIKLESDGEVISLPIHFWKADSFLVQDNNDQIFNGLYFGILTFVFIIYFFFFVALKEKSFLFYVLYVLNIALLQFSLDGLTAKYLFPEWPVIANKTLLLSACFALIFVSLFTRSFLKVAEKVKWIDVVYKVFILLALVCALFTLVGGTMYEITFPIINTVSLFSTLFIVTTIIILRAKKYHVCGYFMTAFILLVAGVTIFILNNLSVLPTNHITQNALKFGTGLEVIFLSLSMANKFRELQMEKEKAQRLAFENLQKINKLTEEANIKLELQVQERTKEIQEQSEIIKEKNKDITDSIKYSKRIQQAILNNPIVFNEKVKEGFIFFRPKDIVSGDFYWFKNLISKVDNSEDKEMVVFAVADCTGHGVPGAFMSIIGHNVLEMSAREENVNSPASALDYLNQKVTETLTHQDTVEKSAEIKDGMDISLVSLDLENRLLQYAGANNPLWYITKNEQGENELFEIKADKQPIGSAAVIDHKPFTNHVLKLEKNTCVYIFSDGFPDQFGGENGKKYKYANFKKFLLSICELNMAEQRQKIKAEFEAWKGDLEQVDDVCIIGVRL